MNKPILFTLTAACAFALHGSPAAIAVEQAGTPAAAAVTLAEKGVARAVIVVDPELANWREKLAVKELSDYLHRVTGAIFPVLTAGQEKDTDACIYMHRSAAAKLGVDLAKLDGQEWIVKTSGRNVYLTGGERDGFLYAVYHFLEDEVGIRWWNEAEEFIPQRPTLAVGPLDARRKPAFDMRWNYVPYARAPAHGGHAALFQLRNRASESWYLPQSDGSAIWQYHYRDLTMPTVHSLLQHVPASHFEKHPEWFAEVGGKRTTSAHDLCLTNPAVRKAMVDAVRGNLQGARASNRRLGSAEPFIVSLGREDNAGWCECAACGAFTRQHSRSDLLLDFVNGVAVDVGREFPDVLLAVLAYQDCAAPPKSVKPAPNVMPMYCFEGFNEARPLDDPANAGILAAVRQWAAISRQSAVYIYHRTFQRFQGSYGGGLGHDFPCPIQMHYARDVRLLRSLGVTRIFNEHEDLLTQDCRDLKAWLMTKLMEDPDQDEGALLDTFLSGYYGAAADAVKRYLTALQKADERKPSRIWFFADVLDYGYLDLEFLTLANGLFEEAARAVDGKVDGQTLQGWQGPLRVNHARLGVDRAILYNWPRLVREWVLQGQQAAEFPFKREELLKRHEGTLVEQMHLRAGYGGPSVERGLGELRHEQGVFADRLYWELPLPERFAGIDRKRVYDFPAQSGAFTLGTEVTTSVIPIATGVASAARSRLVDDPATAGGKAIEVTGTMAALPFAWQYQPTWGDAKPTGRQIQPEQVKGTGYGWYDLGEYNLDTSNSGLIFFAGDERVNFWGCSVDPGKHRLWAEMAFPAAATVRLARIIAVAATAAADADRTTTVKHQGQDVVIYRPSSGWKIATDPSDTGVKDRWFTPGLDESTWRPYSVNLDKGWEAQGFPGYDGYAWFRRDVTVPAEASRRYTYLHFGAVDEQAWLYVDGEPVGEHTVASTGKSPAELWEQPFALPVALTSGRHLLCVRVHDNAGMGGIWRPVHLVASDTPLSTDDITGLVAQAEN